MRISLSICILIFFVVACDLKPSGQKGGGEDEGLVKLYYDNGAIKGEYNQDKDGVRHGLSKTYFPSGKLKTEIVYNHGVKVCSIQYYENGFKEMEFYYVNGVKEGKRTKYWDNGKIQSTLVYKNGDPGKELEEFNKRGDKITKYPKLQVREINNLMSTGEYIVEVYFDKIPGRGSYYQGELKDGYFPNTLAQMKKVDGKGRLVFRPQPGTFLMKNLTFVGQYKTAYGNYYLDEASVNLAIDF